MRTRNWCVTSWTCPDYDSVERLVVSGEYKYVCVGKETCPRTGKVHWHWYLQARRDAAKLAAVRGIRDDDSFDSDWDSPVSDDDAYSVQTAGGTRLCSVCYGNS
jgi:hypothetical protein